MSQTIDNRIVEMQFENKQFESGVQESLSTLDKLKNALKFDDASKNLQDFSKNINKNMDLSGLAQSVEGLSSKFSVSGIAGMETIRKLTDFAIEAGKKIASVLDAPFQQIRSGGWKRAMNIEDAKFQLKGLEVSWDSVKDSINEAVADTAFGLDAAAKACAQLSASGVQAGEDMTRALRGISGVAAMANTEYEAISPIFTKIAGQGKAQAREFQQIATYGLNASASIRDFFNDIVDGNEKTEAIPEDIKNKVKDLTKGLKVTEQDIRDFAHDSEIDFKTFSYAMDYAFGEHAKAANETFMGSLRNIKAALSKIGAEFATPIIHGAVPIFNQIRMFVNELKKSMQPIYDVFAKITEMVSDKITRRIEALRLSLFKFGLIENIGYAIKNVFTSIVKIFVAVKDAFDKVFPSLHRTYEDVESVTKGLENFSKHLVISDEAALVFRNIMIVVFNILKAIGTAIKALLPTVGKVATTALKIINIIVKLVAAIMTFISRLNIVQNVMNAIQKAGGLFAYAVEKIKDAFTKLRGVLSDTSTVTGQVFLRLKEGATTVAYVVGGGLYLAFLKIRDLFSYFNAHDPIGSLVNGITKLKELPVISNIIDGIEIGFGAITLAIAKTIDAVKKFFTEIQNGKSIFDAFATAASGAIDFVADGFFKLTDKIKDAISDFLGLFSKEKVIEENIEIPMEYASQSMVGFVKELSKTEEGVKSTTTALEKGQGTLADYQYQVDTTKNGLEKAKISIVNFAASVLTGAKQIDTGKIMLAAYASILLLIAYNANRLLISFEALTRKLSTGIRGIFRTAPTDFTKFRIAVVEIAASIGALAAAFYMLKDIPTDKLQEIVKSLGILIGLTGGLSLLAVTITNLTAKFGGGGGTKAFSSNMFMLAAGVVGIIGALKLMDTIDMNSIWTKVSVLGAIGAGLTAFSVVMSKFAPQLSLGSVFMVAFATSTLILVKALDNLSKVDLTGISENWKELSIVIVSFAAFAALAGTVGISSLLSLLSFIFGLRMVLMNFDSIKSKLEEYHVGDLIVRFCETVKNQMKAALEYLKGMFDNMSEFDKKAVGWYIGLTSGGLFLVLIGLSKAAKYVKKMAVSATIFALSVTAVMFAVMKIAKACETIKPEGIANAITILEWVARLFLATIALSAIFGGDISMDKFGKGKKGIKTKLGTKFSKTGSTEYLKQARKMMADMAILIASVALFVNVIGKMTPEQIQKAIPILRQVTLVMVGLMIAITAISANAKSAGKASASIAAFIGIIGVIGSLLGAFVILMNYFKNFDFATQWGQLAATLLVLGGIIATVYKFIKTIKSGKQQSAYKSILAFTALLSAVGLVVTYMAKNLNAAELGKAGGIAVSLIIFVGIVSAMVLALEKFSSKMLSTAKGNASVAKTKAFRTTMLAIIAMVASMLLLAGTLYSMATGMDGWDVAKMWAISAILVGTLAALSALVLAIQHFTKDKLTSITKEGGPKLKQTMAMIGMFFLAFEALAGTFALMQGVNPDVMASQMLTIVVALTALTALGLAIQHFVKKLKTDWATIGKAGAIIGGMVALFGIMALIFNVISDIPDPKGMIAKSQIIILAMYELAGLIAIIGVVMKLGAFEIGVGEAALLGMVALFGILSEVFIAIGRLPDAKAILKKSQVIILVMTELVGLIAAMGGLMYAGGEFALGGLAELALWPMINLFDLLVDVFAKINALRVDGIMEKSQTIILVMTELAGIVAAMGLFTPLMALGGLGELALWPMIELFGQLSQAFAIIDGMHLDGLQQKADIIVMTLLKLEGLSAIGGLIGTVLGPGLMVFAEGVQALGAACDSVGNGLNTFAASVERLVATGPSIQMWFTSIAVGVTTLSVSIMTSITGLSKSVVSAIHTLIAGIASAILAGGSIIFAAAVTLGKRMKEGFDSILKPLVWGKELVNNFANGILSAIPVIARAANSVAKTIWSYLHFSDGAEVSYLAGNSVYTWGSHGGQNYANGWESSIPDVGNVVNKIGSTIKNGLSNIDVSNIVDVSGMITGEDTFYGKINSMLHALGVLKEQSRLEQIQSQWTKNGSSVTENYYTTLKGKVSSAERDVTRLERHLNAIPNKTGKMYASVSSQYEKAKKDLSDANKALSEFENGVEEATPEVKKFNEAVGGAGDAGKKGKEGVTELKDEIADFYDSMESAISLFDEFNKETELTSDQLIKNMQSQIDGMSEWANQIQKLAFMGIDQGLLQELANMGPQGYEYTNAFVHMTADQLAQANNLYHQSLMLPAKVTSQIYGSFTIAGRSAASGFMQGMDREQVKTAAVGFAHDVVHQMNQALDIVSAGYSNKTLESGKAITTGILDGIEDPQLKQNLTTAIKVLSDGNILQGIDKGLFKPTNQLYTVGGKITEGIADGIEDPSATGKAKKSVDTLCSMIIMRAKENFDEHSPSVVFKKIGGFLTEGLGIGITDKTQYALSAMDQTSTSIIDTMRNTINRANQALMNDIDEPVITPVLDLSQIEAGSRDLDSMLSRNQALSTARSFTNLQNQQWGSQTALLNATMDNSDVVAAISSLSEDITTLKDAMTNIQLVLDTGTMVGAMTPQIDQQLGMRQVYAGRGI